MIRYDLLNVEKLLTKYNIRNISVRGDEVQFSCPFPEHAHGDRHPSSSINKENGRYHCFACGRSGTLANFLADIEGVPLSVAYGWLEESVGAELNKESSVLKYVKSLFEKDKAKKDKELILPESTLLNFYVDWNFAWRAYKHDGLPNALAYLFRRGLKPEILNEYQVGYDRVSARITFPIRNVDGKLVGIKGRSTKASNLPKYKSIGDKKGKTYGFPTCPIHNYIYGIDSAVSEIILVEGEIDALWLRQNGWLGATALGGSDLSKAQISAIKTVATSATLLLDPDEAGEKATRLLLEVLIGYMPVRIASLVDSDPADTNSEQLNQILTSAQSAFSNKIKQKTQGV